MYPGDLIEWFYKHDNVVVDKNEKIWSSSMQEYVPIGGIFLLISVTEDEFFWLSEKGLFHIPFDDIIYWGARDTGWLTSPRVCKKCVAPNIT